MTHAERQIVMAALSPDAQHRVQEAIYSASVAWRNVTYRQVIALTTAAAEVALIVEGALAILRRDPTRSIITGNRWNA